MSTVSESRWPEPPVAAARLAEMISADRTALLTVDVQVDFVSPEGALGLAGVDMAPLTAPLARIGLLLDAARAHRVQVAHARLVTRADSDSAALRLLYERRGLGRDALELCREGTSGSDYHHIRRRAGEIEVRKLLYSSFHGTDLEQQLRARGIDTLVVCGFTTECCVDSTVRDAFHRGLNVFIVADASAAYSEALHLGSLDALAKNYALLVETEAVLTCWPAVA